MQRRMLKNRDKPVITGWEGPIGGGKSTASELFARHTGAELIIEPVDEERLNEFYQAIELRSDLYLPIAKEIRTRVGFEFQLYMMDRRMRGHRLADARLANGLSTTLDRTLFGDRVFKNMGLEAGWYTQHQSQLYDDLINTFSGMYRSPMHLVYIELSPEKCMERIAKRGRPEEVGITVEYLQALDARYEEWIQEVESGEHFWSAGCTVHRVNGDQSVEGVVEDACIAIYG